MSNFKNQDELNLKKYKNMAKRLAGVILILFATVMGGLHQQYNDSVPPQVVDEPKEAVETEAVPEESEEPIYHFRNAEALNEHYQKHGVEMGFQSPAAYEYAASLVITNPNSLHKLEKEDGDNVFYLPETNEFVIQSKKGVIRTYFCPQDKMAYYNRQ